MHPIERLRYVARASDAEPSLLVRETAAALADVVRVEPVGLVPACRRLIDRHLTVGPVWWLAARMLTASDPVEAAWTAATELDDDPTSAILAAALPDDATVTIVGWPDQAAAAIRRRGDLEVLIADATGDGSALARRLADSGVDVAVVPDTGVAAAAVVSDLVIVEAMAAGPSGVLAAAGSHCGAAVASQAGIPVWAVTGVGRVLPARLWAALLGRLDEGDDEPWDRGVELVPAGLIVATIGPDGRATAAEGLGRATCPVAPELLRATAG
ncbi:MAG TPA: hypothetical protein VKQ71_02625 [Acidimicrobiales bacterium]|nr:hypothetical protein [Acidimicrobiales bacterium]